VKQATCTLMARSNMYTPMGVSSTKARCVVSAHTSHIRVSVSMSEALQAHQIRYTIVSACPAWAVCCKQKCLGRHKGYGMSLKLKSVLAPPDLAQLLGSCWAAAVFASGLACTHKTCYDCVATCRQWCQLMALTQGR
jgi:hypothetical protein